jgi:hypothetical protein
MSPMPEKNEAPAVCRDDTMQVDGVGGLYWAWLDAAEAVMCFKQRVRRLMHARESGDQVILSIISSMKRCLRRPELCGVRVKRRARPDGVGC